MQSRPRESVWWASIAAQQPATLRCPAAIQAKEAGFFRSARHHPQDCCCKAIIPITAPVLVCGACISGAQASLDHSMPLQRSQKRMRAGARWLRCFNIQERTSGVRLPPTPHPPHPTGCCPKQRR